MNNSKSNRQRATGTSSNGFNLDETNLKAISKI